MLYDEHDALGLAALVRRGEADATALAEEAIARLRRLDPALNILITPMFEQARRRAAERPQGPFGGVPFLVKDLMVAIPGVPMTNGSRAMADYRPAEECPQARAMREAGLVVVGKTNTAEMGGSFLTAPRAFGPTCNPWDTRLNSGGSSGGSSAAVAARVVPMASSSDGGGSIRLPASYCGVFGFKPGRGVNPHDTDRAWGGAVVSHATTLSVRDSAAWLDWTSARLAGDPAAPPPGSFLACALTVPRRLRIGVCTVSPADGPVHGECVAAVEAAARLLEDLGHRVEPCPLPYDGPALLRAHLVIIAAFTARGVDDLGRLLGHAPRGLEIGTRMFAELGAGVDDAAMAAARGQWQRAADAVAAFHRDYDVLLTPAAPTLPLAHDALASSWVEDLAAEAFIRLRLGRRLFSERMRDAMIRRAACLVAFSPAANATGQPAMSVPLHWTSDGLPVGVQFTAARGGDGVLFALAGELEAARPWRHRRPPICATQA